MDGSKSNNAKSKKASTADDAAGFVVPFFSQIILLN